MKKIFAILFSFLINFTAAANENAIAVENLLLKEKNGVLTLNADLKIKWNEHLKTTLEHGISIFFVMDAKILKPRWWWWDKEIAVAQKKYQVSYNPITREYRVNLGGLFQPFRDFEALSNAISHIRGWEITSTENLKNNENYTLAFRFALDYEDLPKTFQIGIWGNSEWVLDSGWIFQKNLALTVENLEKTGEKSQ